MALKIKKRPIEEIDVKISTILKKKKLSAKDINTLLAYETNIRHAKIYILRRDLKKILDEITAKVLVNIENGGKLYAKRFLYNDLFVRINNQFQAIILKSVEEQIALTTSRLTRIFSKLGKKTLTKIEQINLNKSIKDSILKSYLRETIGKRIPDQIHKHAYKAQKEIEYLLAKNASERKLKNALVREISFNKYGGKNSLYKKLDRILISDSNKTSQEAVKIFGKDNNILFYKWNTSGHYVPNKTRDEICQVYARQVSAEVSREAISKKLSLGNLQGIYLLENLPSYPHPNCECWIAPIII